MTSFPCLTPQCTSSQAFPLTPGDRHYKISCPCKPVIFFCSEFTGAIIEPNFILTSKAKILGKSGYKLYEDISGFPGGNLVIIKRPQGETCNNSIKITPNHKDILSPVYFSPAKNTILIKRGLYKMIPCKSV